MRGGFMLVAGGRLLVRPLADYLAHRPRSRFDGRPIGLAHYPTQRGLKLYDVGSIIFNHPSSRPSTTFP